MVLLSIFCIMILKQITTASFHIIPKSSFLFIHPLDAMYPIQLRKRLQIHLNQVFMKINGSHSPVQNKVNKRERLKC
jgi:hypothetical protein